MTSEAVTEFSIRRFEANEDRGAYYAVTTKNALGKSDTKQVPETIFQSGGGVRAASEAELKATLVKAQGAYNELHDTLADLNRQAREATQAFEKDIRRLFGVRIGGEAEASDDDDGNGPDTTAANIRIVTPTPDGEQAIEAEEEPVSV